MNELIVSVRDLNQYVNKRISDDALLKEIWIAGEVDDVSTRRPDTAFFELKDEDARVSCVAFQYHELGMAEIVRRGSRVIVRGRIGLYVKSGRFNVTVMEVRFAGDGNLLARLMRLQKKLAAEGLFSAERKRPLPPYPSEVAVVTSASGAARRDIEQVTLRRNPGVKLRLYPVSVQGADAPDSIVAALGAVERDNSADIVIVARGGGSAADLAAFNDERVVRAVAECTVPIVSAVGHETDVTLSDLAADVRASTPSAAAEIAVPDAESIRAKIRQLVSDIQRNARAALDRVAIQLHTQRTNLRAVGIDNRIDVAASTADRLIAQQNSAIRAKLAQIEAELHTERQTLLALNPTRILQSGYAVVLKDGRRVLSADGVQKGDNLQLMFKDGTVEVTVANAGR